MLVMKMTTMIMLKVFCNNCYKIFTKSFTHKTVRMVNNIVSLNFKRSSDHRKLTLGKKYLCYGTLMAQLVMRLLKKCIYM